MVVCKEEEEYRLIWILWEEGEEEEYRLIWMCARRRRRGTSVMMYLLGQ